MIRTCDPLIRSQVLYPTELRVRRDVNIKVQAQLVKRAKNGLWFLVFELPSKVQSPKSKVQSPKPKAQRPKALSSEVPGFRSCRQVRVRDLNLYLVPLSAGAIALSLVRHGVKRSQTRSHVAIQQCHVIETADLV